MRESVRVGIKSGVHFETLQGLSHRRLRSFAAMPLWAAASLPRLMARRMGKTPNPGSTLQSIKRGQTTEVDYLNGAVVRAAQAIGREAPVNAELVRFVHEVEKNKKFFTSAEVVARVRA
jgi:2-dehydropantoate 2-reductase